MVTAAMAGIEPNEETPAHATPDQVQAFAAAAGGMNGR